MPAITAVEQADYPPRVLVSVTGLTIGDTIELYRTVGGERTPVRAGTSASVPDTSFLRLDAELPFGVPVTYVAVVNGTAEYTTAATAHTLPGGKVAVSDAINGNSAEVVILAWDEKSYDRQASVFKVGGRNVVVSGDPGMFGGDIELFVETTSSRDNLMGTLTAATEAVVQIRQPGGYDGVDSYLAVLTVAERRWSQDGSDQRRVISLRVAEVEGWAPTLEALGFTLQDIADVYDVPTVLGTYTFTVDTEGWTAPAGGTLARVATPSEDGDGSLRLTPPGAVAVIDTRPNTNGTSMSGAGSYTATARVQCATAWTSNQVVIGWLTSAGAFISSSFGTVTALTAGTWTTLTVTADSPATAAYARVLVRMSGTPGATNLLYVDDAQVQKAYLTLDDMEDDYATLLALAQGDFS